MQISREKQLRLWYLRVFPMHRYAQYKVKYANIALTILLFLAIWWIQPLKYMRGTDTTVPTTSTISTTVSKSLRSEVSPILHHDYQLVNGCYIDIPEEDRVLHIVHPPVGAVSHLVCCNTTSGLFTIAVHRTWAPIGAARFMDMVESKFFSTRVGLFRSLKGFLVQFGLAGDPVVQTEFHRKGNLIDDPQWLPSGPPGRVINGRKRFKKGYIAYAGGGINSRGTQLILAYEDNEGLGGGSPWEVPFGQLVGEESFLTIRRFYTGYGEEPSQGKIMNKGAAYLDAEFPLLDFINECKIVAENLPYRAVG